MRVNMDFSASEKEALKSTIRALNARLKRKEAEVASLQAQLSSPLQVQLSLLDQDLQSLLCAASGNQELPKAALLERRNRELQVRCDEYYTELVELRRAQRRSTHTDSAKKESTVRREHNRMRSSCL